MDIEIKVYLCKLWPNGQREDLLGEFVRDFNAGCATCKQRVSVSFSLCNAPSIFTQRIILKSFIQDLFWKESLKA